MDRFMCKSFLITKVKKDTDTGPQPVHALAQRRAGKIVFIVGVQESSVITAISPMMSSVVRMPPERSTHEDEFRRGVRRGARAGRPRDSTCAA